MHHTLLDYIWALWQEADSSRLADIGGARTTEGSGPSGDQVETTTLDTPIWMAFLNNDVVVREVMDTFNRDNQGVLCYKYEDSPSLQGKPRF
jgi:tyrosinase